MFAWLYGIVQLREIQFDSWLKVSLFQSFSVNIKILNTQSVFRDHRSVWSPLLQSFIYNELSANFSRLCFYAYNDLEGMSEQSSL